MTETESLTIESTAGEIAADLARRGIPPSRRVKVSVEPEPLPEWIEEARRFSRPKIVAQGWSDDDIDRIVQEERTAHRASKE